MDRSLTTPDPERTLEQQADVEQARVVGVLDGVLSAARALLRCELVALNLVGPDTLLTARAQGHLPGLTPGARYTRTDTPCHRLLSGAPPVTTDAPHDEHYGGAPSVEALGLVSYVGVLVRDPDEEVVATLCGFDRRPLSVEQGSVAVLEGLAAVLTPYAATLRELDAGVARRDGRWLVEGVPAEVAEPAGPVSAPASGAALAALLPGGGQARPSDERAWLTDAVGALERATATRVEVEQAVGRVAERLGVPALEAYRVLEQAASAAGTPVDSAALVAAAPRVLRPGDGAAAPSRRRRTAGSPGGPAVV